MLSPIQSRFEDSLLLRQVGLVLLALAVGVAGGLAVVAGNPVVPFVALAGLVSLPWLVTRPIGDVLLVAATVTLLPFATLPVRLAVLTPTLLEVGLLLLYAAWVLRLLVVSGTERLARTPVDMWLALFLAATLFAFLLGLGRDHATDVIHNYFKLVLAVAVFFAAGNVLRKPEHLALVMRAIIIFGAIEALLGIVLWRLSDTTATSILTRLSVVGYPTDRVVRYVEDNPALGERAVGTQVDPNALGGLLVVVAILTGVQLLARKPVLPRWLLALMLAADLGALLLSQSRTAFLGVVAAAIMVATMRYRRLWGWGIALAVVVAVLGVGSGYLGRIVSGLQFQDQANLMRLAEYRNALDIISRYPAFGVGFGTAGELDLTTGVSSVYLTIAERAGLVGLVLFLITLGVFFANMFPAIVASARRAPPPGDEKEWEWSVLDSTLLGGTAAVLGAALVGIPDHYYFNIEFPHMVALFWLVAAMALAAKRMLFEGEANYSAEQQAEYLPGLGGV